MTTSYTNGGSNASFSVWNYLTRINIDWKTLFLAIIGPIVIRLAFFVLKRLKIYM